MARKRSAKLTPLSDNIKPVVRQIGKRQRNVHPEIWARWVDILGKNLAARAVPQSLRGGRLYIAVANSAWMQELNYLTQTLIEKFQDAIGPDVVKEIRLVLDTSIDIPSAREEKTEITPIRGKAFLPKNLIQMIENVENESVRNAMAKALQASWVQYEDEK